MRKTSVSIFILFFCVNSFAVENCTQINDTKVANELGTSLDPNNCTIVSSPKLLKEFFMFPDSQKKKCSVCQNLLPLTSMDGTDFQKRVIRAALDEVRQKMSRTIISLVSVRSNTSLQFDARSVGNACNISNYKPSNSSCWKLVNEKNGDKSDFVSDLKTQFSNEIASTLVNTKLQQNKFKDNGLFTRDAIDCRFTDYDVLNARTKMIENAFSPNMIKSLKKFFSPNSSNEDGKLSPTEVFELKIKKAMSEVDIKVDFLLKHPMLQKLFRNPEKFQSFVNSLDETKDTRESIRSKINSSENATLFGKSLESECYDSFKNLERIVCDPKLLNGKFAIESKEDLSLLYGTDVPPVGLNESDEIIEEQLTALSGYCKAITLKNEETTVITNIQSPSKQTPSKKVARDIYDRPFYKFKETAYNDIVGQHKNEVCEIESGKSKCEANDSRSICNLYNTLKNQNNPTISGTTVTDKIMAFDENINQVLLSIGGSVDKMTNEAKTILTQHGVLKIESKLAATIPQPSSFQEIEKKITKDKASSRPTTVNTPQPAPQSSISNIPNSAVNASNQNESSNATKTSQTINTASSYKNNNQTQAKETPADDDNSIYKKLLDKISNLPKKPNGETKKLTDQDIQNLVKKALEEQNKQSAETQDVAKEKNKFYENIPRYISNLQSKVPLDQRPPNPISGNPSEQNRPGTIPNNSNAPQDRTVSSQPAPIINTKTNPVTSTTQKTVIKVNTNNIEAIVITLKDEKIKESSEIKNLIANKTNFVLEVNGIPFTINFPNPNDVNSEKLTIATNTSGPIAQGIKEKLETYFHSQEVTNQIRLSNLNNILGTLKL